MKSKLWLHINAWVPGALDYAIRAQPGGVKVLDANLDALRTLKAEIPGVKEHIEIVIIVVIFLSLLPGIIAYLVERRKHRSGAVSR